MRFIIIAYNPNYINHKELLEMEVEIEKDLKCKVYLISHLKVDMEPLYCVKFVDTKTEQEISQEAKIGLK